MDDQVRREVTAHFRREAGGMPAGVRERALDRLAEEAARPGTSRPRRLEWLAAVAAVLLAVCLVGTLVGIGLSRRPSPAGQPAPGPAPRTAPAVAYDGARAGLVLFGGESNRAVLDDTWVWDGHRWTLARPASSPPARQGALSAYDEARRDVVLFGGVDATSAPLFDTWTWDGRDWSRHATATAPPATSADSMAYDPLTRSVLVYMEPRKADVRSAALWRWDGSSWTRLAGGPPAAIEGELVSDGQRMLLLGSAGGGVAAAETWAWEGGAWARLSPATPLPLLVRAGVTGDPAQGHAFVLLDGPAQPETWVWDGATWSRLHPAHEPQLGSGGRLFWDRRASGLVWVGAGAAGRGTQIWRWDGRDWTPDED